MAFHWEAIFQLSATWFFKQNLKLLLCSYTDFLNTNRFLHNIITVINSCHRMHKACFTSILQIRDSFSVLSLWFPLLYIFTMRNNRKICEIRGKLCRISLSFRMLFQYSMALGVKPMHERIWDTFAYNSLWIYLFIRFIFPIELWFFLKPHLHMFTMWFF